MHRFAAAVASLAVALLLTFLLVEDTRPTGSLVVPVLGAVFVVAAVAWAATSETARSAWRDRQRGAGMRKLGEECVGLADELDSFLAERRRAQPKAPADVGEEEALRDVDQTSGSSEETATDYLITVKGRSAEHVAYVRRLWEHDQETMQLYEERFAAAVFRAVHGLHGAGLIWGGEARLLPYPTNVGSIASVARQLRQHGRRLSG